MPWPPRCSTTLAARPASGSPGRTSWPPGTSVPTGARRPAMQWNWATASAVPRSIMRRRTMSRRDAHFDAMLRHLGAAYYDSLHGRAAPADVARAVDSIADHMGEAHLHHPAAAAPAAGHKDSVPRHQHHGRWNSRVRDVMTTSVVTADRITPYKEIARMLTEHEISGVPVLTMGRHVAG